MTLSITITKPFSYDEDGMRSEPRPEDVQQRSILMNDENIGMMATDPYDGFKGLRFALNDLLPHDQRDAVLHVALEIITQEPGELRLWNSDLFNTHRALFEKHGFKKDPIALDDDRPGYRIARPAKAQMQEPTTKPPLSAREAFYYGLPTTPTSLGAGAKPAGHNKQLG